jgi:hypothetical protein
MIAACKTSDVDDFVSSHGLLATNNVVSPSFENHTTSIGSQLLRKMGYTRGGLGKNGQGIVVPISPEIQTSRAGLGYDVVVVASPSTPGLVESRKVLFVAGEVQTELLEEKPTVDCPEQVNEVDMPELENLLQMIVVSNVHGCTHVSTPFEPTKQKSVPYHHPHKNQEEFT